MGLWTPHTLGSGRASGDHREKPHPGAPHPPQDETWSVSARSWAMPRWSGTPAPCPAGPQGGSPSPPGQWVPEPRASTPQNTSRAWGWRGVGQLALGWAWPGTSGISTTPGHHPKEPAQSSTCVAVWDGEPEGPGPDASLPGRCAGPMTAGPLPTKGSSLRWGQAASLQEGGQAGQRPEQRRPTSLSSVCGKTGSRPGHCCLPGVLSPEPVPSPGSFDAARG